jgi:hypothetical protein
MDEVLNWAKRAPSIDGEVEIRQAYEAAACRTEFTPGLREQERRLRDQHQQPAKTAQH